MDFNTHFVTNSWIIVWVHISTFRLFSVLFWAAELTPCCCPSNSVVYLSLEEFKFFSTNTYNCVGVRLFYLLPILFCSFLLNWVAFEKCFNSGYWFTGENEETPANQGLNPKIPGRSFRDRSATHPCTEYDNRTVWGGHFGDIFHSYHL